MCFFSAFAQQELPGVDLVNTPESQVLYKFLTSKQPSGDRTTTKSYISPAYLKAKGYEDAKYRVNMYTPDRFTILKQSGKLVTAMIHSYDSYWAHKTDFHVVKENGKYYISPPEFANAIQYGFFDPWVSIEEDSTSEAKKLSYTEKPKVATIAKTKGDKPNAVIVSNENSKKSIEQTLPQTPMQKNGEINRKYQKHLRTSGEILTAEEYRFYLISNMFDRVSEYIRDDKRHYRARAEAKLAIKQIKLYRNPGMSKARHQLYLAYEEAKKHKCTNTVEFLDLVYRDYDKFQDIARGWQEGTQRYVDMRGTFKDALDQIKYEITVRGPDLLKELEDYYDTIVFLTEGNYQCYINNP